MATYYTDDKYDCRMSRINFFLYQKYPNEKSEKSFIVEDKFDKPSACSIVFFHVKNTIEIIDRIVKYCTQQCVAIGTNYNARINFINNYTVQHLK